MRYSTPYILVALIVSLSFSCTLSRDAQVRMPEVPAQNLQNTALPDSLIPIDPSVQIGSLDNGLTYYIKHNEKPEDRVELRLVVRAGSVLEDDDQRGLAHFVEHMAFNGTKNFQKHELIDYLESIGMRFGADLNAYTSFDETVYMLQVPTDDQEVLETSFQILSDWAHNISFASDEIDSERGVIIEEWRSGRGAAARLRDKQYPILLKDSRYAERMPIGNVKTLETFKHDSLLRFYHDWYRPDLMAVIAVGDVDGNGIDKLIHKYFDTIPQPSHPRERKFYPVPDHDDVLYAVFTDPEATQSTIGVYYKHDVKRDSTVTDYRASIIENLFNTMFSQRLDELTREADPPYLYAYAGRTGLQTKDFFILGSAVKENGIERGLKAILTEAERIRQHGFTQSELDRAGDELLRRMETSYAELEKTESGTLASEYIRNFTESEVIPGIEYEFSLYKEFIPVITLDEVNSLPEKLITEKNRVVMANLPEKDGITVPTESQLSSIFDEVAQTPVTPYVDSVSDQPLAEIHSTPGKIADERYLEDIDVTILTLDNGIRIVLKPTDFKNDEILFRATSPGGNSLVPDNEYISALSAPDIVEESGIGAFSLTELEKKLSGKVVEVSPWISELEEGLSGSASPKDIETLFQLIHLYITDPRKDETAFQSYKSRLKGYIENRGAQPETAFNDTIQVTLADYHYRSRPWTLDLLDEILFTDVYDVYADRFADSGDFTFYFVGAFEIEKIKPLITTWIGSLPSTGRDETWHDIGEKYPKGVIKKQVLRGIEDKSQVRLYFTGPFEWSRHNRYLIDSMSRILRIRFREVIREELGGTYGVGIFPNLSHYPKEEYQVSIGFGCEPERVDELTAKLLDVIRTIQYEGTSEQYLEKVKETQKREFEVQIKENDYWLSVLSSYEFHQEDISEILKYNELVDALSLADIQDAAKQYFDFENYVQVVLLPETQ